MKRIAMIAFLAIVWGLSGTAVAFAAEKSNWEKQWKKTLQAAGKEGQVNVYIYGSSAPLDTGVFQTKIFRDQALCGVGSRRSSLCLAEITELYEGAVNGRPVFHDGRWGKQRSKCAWGAVAPSPGAGLKDGVG